MVPGTEKVISECSLLLQNWYQLPFTSHILFYCRQFGLSSASWFFWYWPDLLLQLQTPIGQIWVILLLQVAWSRMVPLTYLVTGYLSPWPLDHVAFRKPLIPPWSGKFYMVVRSFQRDWSEKGFLTSSLEVVHHHVQCILLKQITRPVHIQGVGIDFTSWWRTMSHFAKSHAYRKEELQSFI